MRAFFPLALAAVTAAAATAHADPNANELSLGGTGRALRSPSANALTDNNLAGVALGLARALGLAPLPDLTLWAEAGFTATSTDGTMFQSLSTEISQLGLTGGLAVRYQLHRLVVASARLAFGAQRARVAITDRADSASAYDHAWGAMTSAGAALDLVTGNRARFGIGVRVQVDYVAAQSIALAPHRDSDGTAIPLAMTDAPLGHLDLSGPSVAISLLGQF